MTLAACGVRPTPVLTGADAPTVAVHEVTIYLLAAKGEGLVRRTRSYTGTVDTTTAVNLLVAGLTDEEKQLGLVTEVPATSSRVLAVSNVILLPEDMGPLSKMAQFQVYCTAIASRAKVEGVPASGFDCP
ncbi:hypothetical protein ACIA8G_00665 [Lentzea sp. NPDC051213]|uniref:hypothetical protein n=1 Tax=Lentzea sp. NPDC051213 TaxID=3364126 RepID=UPI00378DE963